MVEKKIVRRPQWEDCRIYFMRLIASRDRETYAPPGRPAANIHHKGEQQ
jgi:hypothetical protein